MALQVTTVCALLAGGALATLNPKPYHQVPGLYDFTSEAASSGYDYIHYDNSGGHPLIRGQYSVRLPDGRTQVVKYTADETGYHPLVNYTGHAVYPAYIPIVYELPHEPYKHTPEPYKHTLAPYKHTPGPYKHTPEPYKHTPGPYKHTPGPYKHTPEPYKHTPEPLVGIPSPSKPPIPTYKPPIPTYKPPITPYKPLYVEEDTSHPMVPAVSHKTTETTQTTTPAPSKTTPLSYKSTPAPSKATPLYKSTPLSYKSTPAPSKATPLYKSTPLSYKSTPASYKSLYIPYHPTVHPLQRPTYPTFHPSTYSPVRQKGGVYFPQPTYMPHHIPLY